MSRSFRGRINDAGRFIVDPRDESARAALFGKFVGKDVEVTVQPAEDQAVAAIRAYYFAEVVEKVGRFLSQGRVVPLSKSQIHSILKEAFIDDQDSEPEQEPTILGPVPRKEKTTTKFRTVDRWMDYIESVCSHFAAEHGLEFESPADR